MLVMAILLALCVGAVSAADTADMANGGIADIAVSPVSEDISVLADGEDPDDIRINSSDENQTVNIEVSKDNITVPGNRSVEFDIKVLNGSEELDFAKENLSLKLYYGEDSGDLEFNLSDKTISFLIPDDIFNPNSVVIFYNTDVANATVLLRFINATIEVPESIYVDEETKTGNFNIKVLDVDTAMSIADKDLVIKYVKDNTVIQFMANETLFKEGTYDVINESGTIYIRVGNETDYIDYPVSVYTTLKEVTEEQTIDNQTVNVTVNKTVYYPVAYTLKDGVISFRLPGNDTGSQILTVIYENQTVTPVVSLKNITLKIVTSNNINVENIIQLEVDKSMEFEINVTDKNGNLIFMNEEDFEFYMICYGENISSEQIKITNFTFTPVKYDKYIDNETNETIIENITIAKISFVLPDEFLGNNYTDAKLNITYKNNDPEEAFANRNVAFIDIIVLDTQSETEYQNNYFVIKVWDNYNNIAYANKTVKTTMSKTIFGENIGSTFKTDKDGYLVQNDGKKITADFLYGFGGYYIPVGTGYFVELHPEGYVAQAHRITFNITPAQATLTIETKSVVYGSGNPVVIKLVNSKNKGIAGSQITFKIYSKKWITATVTTGADGKATIRLNGFGAGTYKVQAVNSNTGSVIAKTNSSTVTIKAVKAIISAKKTTAYYNYGSKFKVKMTNSKGVALKGAIVLLNIYTGKKYKAVSLMTDDKGYAYWKVSGISIAKHRVLIGSGSTGATANVVQTYITLKKGKTTVSAPKVTNKYKKSAYFKITIKNAGTKKPLKGIVLKVKVYTGKKYKTYKIKTNSKGVASLNTKALKKGTHKVVITTTNKKYTVSKSGKLIVIKK